MIRKVENADRVADTQIGHRSRAWRFGRWTIIVLVLLSFALNVYDLGGREFWLDEALSANVSGLGWAGAIEHLRSSPFEHPPVYFLGLNLWQKLAGTTEFGLRFFSLLWGVLYVPLLYGLTKRLAGERLGVLAALLSTLSPFMVAYAQEARMYTLLPCLALLALQAFWNGLEREHQPLWWLVYLVTMTLGVFTHYLFILLWLATALYLLLDYLRLRKVRGWAIVAQGLPLVVSAVWLAFSPGVLESLHHIVQDAAPFSLAYQLDKIMSRLLFAETEAQQFSYGAYTLVALGWLLILLGVWWSRRSRILDTQVWLLLASTLLIPLAAALVLPYNVQGRHLGYVLIPGFVFMGLGLLALRRQGTLLLGAGVLVVLLISSFGLVTHFRSEGGSFGEAMAYIDRRGQPGDTLVISQPLDEHLATYYNEHDWPIMYLPAIGIPLKTADVDETLSALSREHARIWLGPAGAWTADPEYLAEQWFAVNAFQAEKVWFPDSSSVALYLASQAGLARVDVGELAWEGRIHLNRLAASSLLVPIGDAVRLRFNWQPASAIDGRYEVSLQLVDAAGYVWAERRGEPCGGWCPTDEWSAGESVRDQHALVIPPGTPPGTYHLQATWLPLGGGPPLQAVHNGALADRVSLAEVTVLPGGLTQEPWDVPNRLQVSFGGEVTLVGYAPAAASARLGEALPVETYWRADALPSTYYALALEVVDDDGLIVANSVSLLTPSFPTSLWQPGQYLHGQQHLTLPPSLTPGRYRLRIALISPEGERLAAMGQASRPARLRDGELYVATIDAQDRPRQFDLPSVTNVVSGTVGKQAHLVGYDLVALDARPGGEVSLTLYWQAGGPMVRPFKIFTHLVDEEGAIRAQHDAPPGGGCCPANTWEEGEVIVDEHTIALGTDLEPGTYWLRAGMYDEETRSRMPAYDAEGASVEDGRIEITELSIEPLPGQEEVEVILPSIGELPFTNFLPLVTRGASLPR